MISAPWRDGILEIPDLTALQQLLITNDSVFGPLQRFLASVLERFDAARGDVWGITESSIPATHLQSYFPDVRRAGAARADVSQILGRHALCREQARRDLQI
ncbi:MAG: hypothetical protein WDN69_14865 [Aliidongia sp.]